SDDAINHFPHWQDVRFKEWNNAGAAYIHIISENLSVFKDVSAERIGRFQKASRTMLKDHHTKIRSHEIRWCLIADPNVVWASRVFPKLSKEEALQSLWEIIVKGSRADGETRLKYWEIHNREFESRKEILNESQFKSLHFINC